MNEISQQQIVDEYNARYKPIPNPFTHPELFDPLDPPEGYTYDAWHAVWYKTPTEREYRFNVAVIWAGVAVVVCYVIYSLAKVAW